MDNVRIIDLFAGIGGIRRGFEYACKDSNIDCECVFTSEIKPHAIKILKQNYPQEKIYGDITEISADDIPNFDILLAGFPCQAFSAAGKRLGFADTRGSLFFEVERILKAKKPFGFLLENVEGLVNHDKANKNDKIGITFSTILHSLDMLGYKTSWKILNAKDFGVPQDRKRVYIVGTKAEYPNLCDFTYSKTALKDFIENGLQTEKSDFIDLIISHYKINELYGKSIKDKRGGLNNIHSWDIEYKGAVTERQKHLLNLMLKERRKKKWAEKYGIDWMDGMPLTYDNIRTFFDDDNLKDILNDLVNKKYLVYEHPKRKVGNRRIEDDSLPLGYNIVAGKMSYEINKILDPDDISPTLVAMDMSGLYVVDGDGLRKLTLREGLRLFGYPDSFNFDISRDEGYDLLGNTVVVPVIKAVSKRVLSIYKEMINYDINRK